MSFYSSVMFYRPTPPPVITGADLWQFIERLLAVDLITDPTQAFVARVKFGEAIDQDDAVEDDDASFDWDIEVPGRPRVEDLAELLGSETRCVYRARVMFNMPTEAVRLPITRMDSPENDINFTPDAMSIEVGPILSTGIGSDDIAHVGWFAVNFGGYGYLYPWTMRDVVARVSASEAMQSMEAVCRETWPVEHTQPPDRVITGRQELGNIWPYDAEADYDWFWGVMETG